MTTPTSSLPQAVSPTAAAQILEPGAVIVHRHGVGETHGGARCQFGEPHSWQFGFYAEDDQWRDDRVVCLRCGREESE